MSFLFVTVPVSLLVAGSLLALVLYAVHSGAFDDWEGPAQRHALDDDRVPETPGGRDAPGEKGRVGRHSSPAGASAQRQIEGGAQEIRRGEEAHEQILPGAGLDDGETAVALLEEPGRGFPEARPGGHEDG